MAMECVLSVSVHLPPLGHVMYVDIPGEEAF